MYNRGCSFRAASSKKTKKMNNSKKNADEVKNSVTSSENANSNNGSQVICVTTPKALNMAVGLAVLGVTVAVVTNYITKTNIKVNAACMAAKHNQEILDNVLCDLENRCW